MSDAFTDKFVIPILEHLNEDHRQDMLDLAHGLGGQRWAEDATVLGFDKRGIDLVLRGAGREEPLRIPFDPPLQRNNQLRPTLIALIERAQQALAGAATS